MNQFFQTFIDSIFGNIQLKIMRKLWQVVDGFRRFCILIILLLTSVVMMSLGIFSAISYALYQYMEKGQIEFNLLLNFMIGDAGFFLIFFFIIFRRRTWFKASGLAKHFETL